MPRKKKLEFKEPLSQEKLNEEGWEFVEVKKGKYIYREKS